MRRKLFLAFAALLLLAPPAMAQRRMMGGDMIIDDEWDGPLSRADPAPELIRSALQIQRQPGQDNWAWRNGVEDRLVSLGTDAGGYMRIEAQQRDGYEADALQVAIFRLQNPPLTPNDVLLAWGEKHLGFSIPPAENPVNPLKIFRVMDGRNGAGLLELFPHHLFYALEYQRTRLVVALAADAKVQPLEDDAALLRFMQAETQPQLSVDDKSRLASAAALLMLSRNVTTYNPDYHRQLLDTDLHTYRFTLQFEGFRQTAALTFTPAGTIATLTSGEVKTEVKPAAPISAPSTATPPPAMPGF